MQDLRVYEVIKNKSFAEVKRKIRGTDTLKFRCERLNILVINEKTREVYCFNKFTGCRIPNYRAEDKPLAFVPEKFKKETKTGRKMLDEMDLLKKNLVPKDIIGLAFFNRIENNLKEDFPEVVQAAVTEHKRRFHG